MSKLENKLIELGYERSYTMRPDIWEKDSNGFIIRIFTSNGIKGFVTQLSSFKTQKYIDYLQQTFNVMQKDLEILKECGDSEGN